LQPHLLESRYAPTKLDRRGTKAWDAAQEEAGARELLKEPDWIDCQRIRDAVHAHPVAGPLLAANVRFEESFYFRDPDTGILRRGRYDGLREDWRVLIDLKSTVCAQKDEFTGSVAKYKYHWQDVYYREGIEILRGWEPAAFVFLAVEKEPPFLLNAFEIDPEDLHRARISVRDNLDRYAECLRTDTWPGYPDTDKTQLLSLPHWARAKELS
jgi:exodeoxyribonuclease VIII